MIHVCVRPRVLARLRPSLFGKRRGIRLELAVLGAAGLPALAILCLSLADGGPRTIAAAGAEPKEPAIPAIPATDIDQAGVGASWWQAVSADLGRREYAASATSQGLQAPNRAHNLRTIFGERGIEVQPRTAKDVAPAWRFGWEASGIGRAGRMAAAGAASLEAVGNRVTYRRDGWSEWYENTANGLEQGFTIDRRPPGAGPLRVAGRFPAALRAERRADGAIDFIDGQGARAIRYGEPHAYDAAGGELAAELVVAANELAIVVHDEGAAYPLTIDPLMTSPAWTAESNQAGAYFGATVSTAGDVNGDGFSDVIVGAILYDNGQVDEGRVYLYVGSAGGLSITPAWTAESNQAGAQLGYAVGTAGDVNGDGYADVIVTAGLYDNGETDEGRAYVYLGSAAGLAAAPAWTAEGDQAGARFGYSAQTAGDVNGDGFADVIVGASQYDNGQTDEGRAYVYHGSASGLSLTPDWTAESDQAAAWFGISVATAGDVNGDGFADVVVGAPYYDSGQADEGRVYAYLGSASGLATSPFWTAESNLAGALFGISTGTAGDTNGDGYSDVIVGAYTYANGQFQEGRAFVYLGSGTGLGVSATWFVESQQAGAQLGNCVATAGDVNGDGYGDVIVGAWGYDNGQGNEGRAMVYLGGADGLSGVATWTAESNQNSAQFGTCVATAGDVNGDGYSDVIVGALYYDNGQNDEGRAFLYLGSGSGLVSAALVTSGGQAEALLGYSVATAGDVNGDGYSDVIIGAPLFDNGELDEGRAYAYYGSATGLGTSPDWTVESNQPGAEFGGAVATAGDVNGDGYCDVIVGAQLFDGGQTNEGRTFLYLGSAVGLRTTPAWIAEGNQYDAQFGCSVATAGDVNGDGFSDLVIGAEHYSLNQLREGRAFVYHGSASGPASAPAWAVSSGQQNANLGVSVSTAGDVNGDGFSDVIVGADQYLSGIGGQPEGRAWVYYGSAAGLLASHSWTEKGRSAGASFGHSVASAGDVNGDGYSDVIVGAVRESNPQVSEGQASVYHGSAVGLGLATWTAEINQASSGFGWSVSTAGDVNGDGYSDVIVGCPFYDDPQVDAGFVAIYLGSAFGLSSVPSWNTSSNQAYAEEGRSVGAAGDVNGDGFSDVVVGIASFDLTSSNEGIAVVLFGNAGIGRDRIARQTRTVGSTPIPLLGRSDSPHSFGLQALGRTAAGRGLVQLEYEVKPFGVPFNGAGLVAGGIWDTGAPSPDVGSVVPLAELAGGLDGDTLYHWRLRIAADSPYFPRSPWFSQVGNGMAEADLRTAPAVVAVPDGAWPVGGQPTLDPVWPNPLRGRAEIAYALPAAERVRVAIYDVAGRRVALLADGAQESGRHVTQWDGRDARGNTVAAGVYFVRVEGAHAVTTRKVVVVR